MPTYDSALQAMPSKDSTPRSSAISSLRAVSIVRLLRGLDVVVGLGGLRHGAVGEEVVLLGGRLLEGGARHAVAAQLAPGT